MKLFFQENNAPPELRHQFEAHDVGVADGTLPDEYGWRSKCPPGTFLVGNPMSCAIRKRDGSIQVVNNDDPAYGCFFTPLFDETANGPMAQHNRAGIGIHGGGSDLHDPFALHQGWEWTYGCIRLQNIDNETIFVPFVKYILGHGGKVECTVEW